MATGSLHRVTDLEKAMRLLATRVSWTMGAKFIDAASLYKSRGWDETIRVMRQQTMDGAMRARATDSLVGVLNRHILIGGKQVFWYDWTRLNAAQLAGSRGWVRDVDADDLVGHPFEVLSTPYLQGDLRPLLGSPPRLVSAQRERQRLTLVFFGVRTFTTRESIDLTAMNDDERSRFNDYLEVIGVKARNVPCFDVVVFDLAKNRVEVRMDRQPGMQSDGTDSAFSQIIEQINRVIFTATGHMPIGHGLTNFFPAVNRLYRDPSAGMVEMLGFVATARDKSSNNKGVVHRRDDQDLRVDPFHVGGKSAVGTVEPYTIGISAESLSGVERLHLELRSSARTLLGGGNPRFIGHAMFEGCATSADFDLLTSLLEDHLIDPAA